MITVGTRELISFCMGWKIIYFVFVKLSDNLFTVNHSRRIQGKDRKSNREKQGKTHDGNKNRMGTRKKSKIHGQTHKKPSKHNIQGKSQNAGSKSQLQKQVPRQSMQDMPPRGRNPRSRTTTMRKERHTKNNKRGNLQWEHRHPEKSCGKDTSNYESTNMR